MLPMPLPISSIAEERSTALGSVMSEPLTAPICTKRIGAPSAAALRGRDQQALGAASPEIVDDDIHAFANAV